MKPFGSKRLISKDIFPPLSLRTMTYIKGGGEIVINLDKKITCWMMQERKTERILMYLAWEHMLNEVKQLRRKNWVRQPKKECCTRALCIKVR